MMHSYKISDMPERLQRFLWYMVGLIVGLLVPSDARGFAAIMLAAGLGLALLVVLLVKLHEKVESLW